MKSLQELHPNEYLYINLGGLTFLAALFAPFSQGLEMFIISWVLWEGMLSCCRVTPNYYTQKGRILTDYFSGNKLFIIFYSIIIWSFMVIVVFKRRCFKFLC